MLSLRLSFVFYASVLSRLAVADDVEWKSDQGGNLRLWGQSDKHNWGDQRPADILGKVLDKCGTGPTCREDDYSWETQVVVKGKNVRKKIVVDIKESNFDEKLPQANSKAMFEALKKLVDTDPWMNSERQHWDADSEQASCPSANSNYCWIPNKDEGDLDQFFAPVSVYATYRENDEAQVSHVKLAITLEDLAPSPWSCENVIEKVKMVADAIASIPGFQLLDLYCALMHVGSK